MQPGLEEREERDGDRVREVERVRAGGLERGAALEHALVPRHVLPQRAVLAARAALRVERARGHDRDAEARALLAVEQNVVEHAAPHREAVLGLGLGEQRARYGRLRQRTRPAHHLHDA